MQSIVTAGLKENIGACTKLKLHIKPALNEALKIWRRMEGNFERQAWEKTHKLLWRTSKFGSILTSTQTCWRTSNACKLGLKYKSNFEARNTRGRGCSNEQPGKCPESCKCRQPRASVWPCLAGGGGARVSRRLHQQKLVATSRPKAVPLEFDGLFQDGLLTGRINRKLQLTKVKICRSFKGCYPSSPSLHGDRIGKPNLSYSFSFANHHSSATRTWPGHEIFKNVSENQTDRRRVKPKRCLSWSTSPWFS